MGKRVLVYTNSATQKEVEQRRENTTPARQVGSGEDTGSEEGTKATKRQKKNKLRRRKNIATNRGRKHTDKRN